MEACFSLKIRPELNRVEPHSRCGEVLEKQQIIPTVLKHHEPESLLDKPDLSSP